MHMQIRTKLGTASGIINGSGAMSFVPVEVDPLELRRRALLELLTLLAGNGYDLAMAWGHSIEGAGDFVFSIKHEDEEEGAEAGRYGDCAALLREHGYRQVRIVEPQHTDLDDHEGALRDWIDEITGDGSQVDELFIGVAHDGIVPVQATTIRTVE